MRISQNTSANKIKTQESQQLHTGRGSQSSIGLHRDKSIPKFNRKTQVRPFSRKRSDSKEENQEPICYISPKRSRNDFNDKLRSPKFQEVAHKFSSSIFGDSTDREFDLDLSSKLKHSRNNSRQMSYRSKVNNYQYESYQRQIDELKDQNIKLTQQNTKMKEQLKQLPEVKAFLVERQSYIFQITQKNQKIYEEYQNLKKSSQEKLELYQTQQKLINQKANIEIQQYLTEIDSKKNEIKKILKQNSALREEIKNVKKNKELQRKNSNKKCKQNYQHFNRSKKRSSGKVKTEYTGNNSFWKEIQAAVKKDHSEINFKQTQDTIIKQDDCTEIQPFYSKQFDGSASYSCPFTHRQSNIPQNHTIFQQQLLQQTIKSLKQKLRYNEIEIDILKKMKLDTSKIKQENNNLKHKNRKLLQRIEYLSHRSRKQRNMSNSSLELSLSPRKS